jgi:hypothetical protein
VPAAVEVVLDAPLPRACPDRASSLDAEVQRLEDGIAAALFQQRIIEHRRVQREGVESLWPAEPNPLTRPKAWGAAVEGALADVGGELLALECDEYPCVTAFRMPKLDDVDGISGDAEDAFYEALNARGYEDHEIGASSTWTQDGQYHIVVAAVPSSEAPELKRLGFRVNRMSKELSAAQEVE